MNTTTKASLGQPALIGGLVMGVLSALPIVSAGNFCCCLWVFAGGLVAAYVLQQNQSAPITPADGALVGLLAGLCGAVIQVVVSIPMTLIMGPMQRALFERIADMAGTVPPELRSILERARGDATRGAFLLVSGMVALVAWMFVGAVFSTIGGVVGAAIFKKPTPPGPVPGPVDVPPPIA